MLFMVEMWERFNYYGMRALLSLFMISAVINFSKDAASKVYGMFTALVYLTPVVGGYLADRYNKIHHHRKQYLEQCQDYFCMSSHSNISVGCVQFLQ